MSTLVAYDALGSGLDMSGTQDGFGYFTNDPSISSEFLGVIDDYTIAFTVAGLEPSAYFTVSGTVNLNNGDLFITDLFLFDSDIDATIGWSDVNLITNVFEDFSQGGVFSVLNGNDLIIGNSFDDIIKSGNGSDIISGSSGNDQLFGENGNDVVYGNHGLDTLFGGAGNDILFGGQNSGAFTGGVGSAGDGILKQRDGVEFLYGNSGNDVIYGNYGSDYLDGGSGNDGLFGGQDIDTLVGGLGNDTLNGNRGDDILIGDSGADTFVLSGTGSNVVLDFSGAEGDRIDVISPAEVIVTTSATGNVLLSSGSNLGGVSIELTGVSLSQFDSTWLV